MCVYDEIANEPRDQYAFNEQNSERVSVHEQRTQGVLLKGVGTKALPDCPVYTRAR